MLLTSLQGKRMGKGIGKSKVCLNHSKCTMGIAKLLNGRQVILTIVVTLSLLLLSQSFSNFRVSSLTSCHSMRVESTQPEVTMFCSNLDNHCPDGKICTGTVMPHKDRVYLDKHYKHEIGIIIGYCIVVEDYPHLHM